MTKIALFLVAVAIFGTASAAITDCLLEDGATSGAKCHLCKAGKWQSSSAMTDCTGSVGSGCVFGGAYHTWPTGFTGWCEICEAGKTVQAATGGCVVAATTNTLTACGLKTADGASSALVCLGCDNAASTYNTIAATTGCSTAGTAPTELVKEADQVTVGTLKVCHPNAQYKFATAAGADDFKCGSASGTPNGGPTNSHFLYVKANTATVPIIYWTSATTHAIKITGTAFAATSVSTEGFSTGCWFTDGANCIRCRPDFSTKFETTGTSPSLKLKATCTAWVTPTATSGAGSGKACRASWMNATVEQCIKCADSTGALSDAAANFSCAWAAANSSNSSNSSNTNKSSSILGFSVAAFLLLIINRLF